MNEWAGWEKKTPDPCEAGVYMRALRRIVVFLTARLVGC